VCQRTTRWGRGAKVRRCDMNCDAATEQSEDERKVRTVGWGDRQTRGTQKSLLKAREESKWELRRRRRGGNVVVNAISGRTTFSHLCFFEASRKNQKFCGELN